MDVVTLFVPGIPVSQPRQRIAVKGGRVLNYTPGDAGVQAWKALVRMVCRSEWEGAASDANVSLNLVFVFPRPKYLLHQSFDDARIKRASKPDIDNLIKAVQDALNGVLYMDDAQIVSISATKEYCARHNDPSGLHLVAVLHERLVKNAKRYSGPSVCREGQEIVSRRKPIRGLPSIDEAELCNGEAAEGGQEEEVMDT